jgi:hypothetical protein
MSTSQTTFAMDRASVKSLQYLQESSMDMGEPWPNNYALDNACGNKLCKLFFYS